MNGRIKRNEAQQSKLVLPRIGKIKVGMKSEKGFPTSVDYFIATGKYEGLFRQAYGERPQSIQIVFPSDDATQVCAEQYEYRDDAGKLIARGDGEMFVVWDGKGYRAFSTAQYPDLMDKIQARHPNKAYTRTGDGWKVKLTLNFIVPLVRGVAGLWTFETFGTLSTIPNIRDAFDTMLEQRGFVRGIVFDLNVKFAISQKPHDNSRYPVVSLVANESEDNLRLIKRAYEPLKIEK